MGNFALYYDFRLVFLKANLYSSKNFFIKIFYEKFLNVTIFEEMIFQQKHFGPNFFSKLFHPNDFRGNDFATITKFRPKLLNKIMGNFALYYDFPLVFLKRNIFQ